MLFVCLFVFFASISSLSLSLPLFYSSYLIVYHSLNHSDISIILFLNYYHSDNISFAFFLTFCSFFLSIYSIDLFLYWSIYLRFRPIPFISRLSFPGALTLGLIHSCTSAPLYRSRCTDIEYMNGIFKLFFFSFFRTGYWIIVFQNANRQRRGLCDQCQNFNISTDPKSYFIFRILSEDGASLASVNRYPRGRNMTFTYAGHKDEYRKTT